ncbi:Histidine--tRNA ligase [bacterium HR35]|nr:Histidine--tRNA ligase [bacterium HR35]
MKLPFTKPKGMKDNFGNDAEFYLKLYDLLYDFSVKYGFKYIETPLVENEKVFTTSLGQTSDVVEKEMFYLKTDEKKEKYVLRPENTAPIMRVYLEEGLYSEPQPLLFFYIGKMYRKENPQRGRLREFTQWGLEIVGSENSFADFYIIFTGYKFLKEILNFSEIKVKLNSLGCEKCRPKYKKKLTSYYRRYKNKICHDCQRRLKENPLRLLDCKNAICQPYKKNAPNILDSLCKFCSLHFQEIISYLDKSEINYELDYTLVRGFDYYERTVFEYFLQEDNLALGGGGRYDLGKIWVNTPTPAVGLALGLERLKLILEEKGIELKYSPKPDVFVAYVGEELKIRAFQIIENLRNEGLNVSFNFFKQSLSQQLEYANKIGVKYVVIVAFEELSKNSVILKDFESGAQETISISKLVNEIKNRLTSQNV